MRFLFTFAGLTITKVHARVIEQLGGCNPQLQPGCQQATGAPLGGYAPGIGAMWGQLKQTFPHTDWGSRGLEFILAIITHLILRMIGGIAVLMIVYGGIRMIMTVYDENGHAEAKKIVVAACVGLILAIAADVIVLYAQYLTCLAAGGMQQCTFF